MPIVHPGRRNVPIAQPGRVKCVPIVQPRRGKKHAYSLTWEVKKAHL